MTTSKIKYAFSANAFRRYSLVETIEILSEIGYQGIEIMADSPHAYPPDLSDQEISDIRKVLEIHGMAVSNVNAFMLHAVGDTWHPSWIEKTPELRQIRVDYTRQCIALAEKIGAPCITTEPGGPLDGMSPKQGIRIFLEGLLSIQDLAREKDIRVLIEPEPDLLIENSRQFLNFYQKLDPMVFGMNFDIGHFFCVNENPASLIPKLKNIIGHFHLEDIAETRVHRHLMLGEGALDIKGILRIISEIGYEGFVTVELYPYEDQPVKAAKHAFEYLSKIQWNA